MNVGRIDEQMVASSGTVSGRKKHHDVKKLPKTDWSVGKEGVEGRLAVVVLSVGLCVLRNV
eukprot:535818-Pelagomonas_calceolata.AAC.1